MLLAKKYYTYGTLICIYDLENRVLIKEINNINEHNPKHVLCFKIKNNEDFKHNDLNICYDDFPWKTYFKINRELLSNDASHNNRHTAWNHWINYGIKEERAFSYVNNTNDHRARLGNLFFLNMCLHLFSKKYDLKSNYKYEKEFRKLGLEFYKGKNIYSKNLLLTDYNFEKLLESDVSPKNVIINNNVWFHTNNFCRTIKKYFIENNLFDVICENNIYKNRYNKNDDLFIHVRLGDVTEKTQNLYNYYDKITSLLKFNKGYIASDDINNEICKKLIKKFKLNIIYKSEVETIMFSNTCKYLILSGGTFSWLIGFLSLNTSIVFYPDIKDKWYGDIFDCFNWKKISIETI